MIVPDATRAHDRHLVERLHDIADRATEPLAGIIRDAAVALDEYQSGARLATPRPDSGYRLLPTSATSLLDAYEQTDATAHLTALELA